MKHLSNLSIAAALLAGSASAQSYLEFTGGSASAVSGNGFFAVGSDGAGAYRYNVITGDLVSLTGSFEARGVTLDGQTVFGSFGSPNEAAIWTLFDGWTSLGGLGTSGCPDLSNPYAFSDDGGVGVGLGWDGCSASAFKWTPGPDADGTMVALPQQGPFSSRANGVSGDGSTIGGWDEGPTGSRRAKIWYDDGTELFVLEGITADAIGETWGFSTDGDYAVGQGQAGGVGFRYQRSTDTLIPIGPVPGAQPGSQVICRAVSDDGKTIVGGVGQFGLFQPFIWTEDDGASLLVDYLSNLGVTASPNMWIAEDMSADGKTIVGYTTVGPFADMSFVVTLPDDCGVSTYGVGATPVNALDLAGGGGTGLGETFFATTSGAAGAVTVTALSLGEANLPLFGGALLVDPTSLVGSLLVEVPTGGVSTNTIGIPTGVAIAGVSIYFQSASENGAQPEGWDLSNGLLLTVCP